MIFSNINFTKYKSKILKVKHCWRMRGGEKDKNHFILTVNFFNSCLDIDFGPHNINYNYNI